MEFVSTVYNEPSAFWPEKLSPAIPMVADGLELPNRSARIYKIA
jgi:hypothetical protein